MGAHTRAHVPRPSARARVSVCDWARTHPRRHMRARAVGVDRGWLGSQAFRSASAFNANIGAWNTARVTTLSAVCAAFSGPGGAPPRGGTRSAGSSVRRGPLCTVYVRTLHACIYIHARLATPMNGSPMQARRTHARTCRVRARARVSVCDWAPTHPRRHMRARSAGVDRGWLGPQAFNSATAFSADIGAWNTARVTTLSAVCAAYSGPGGAPPRGGTRSAGSSVRRGPLCAAAPPMRARACVRRRAGTRMRECARV
jgi:hypothetical protein